MKYAITGPAGRINKVLDEPNDQTVEITNKQATLVAAAQFPDGYFIVDGEFMSSAEKREREKAARQAEREAEREASLTPEQKEARLKRATSKAAYDAAAAAFATLPLGKQALWEPVRKAVAEAIQKGDFATAKEILLTTPVIYEEAENDRAVFLELFPE